MTATIETPTDARRTPAPRTRPSVADVQPKLAEVRENAETAVTHLMNATADSVKTFVPSIMLRPTEAVEFTFDLAEQILGASRKISLEIAGRIESAMDGLGERKTA